MLTILHRLPQLSAASTQRADREFRWALMMLIQLHASRTQLGHHFESVSVSTSDQAGVPLELGFHFRGLNRHGAENDVAVYVRDLEAESRAGCAKS